MILCITLNPCLDKSLTVPAWNPGDSVRGRAIREVVGGKGNNVARALAKLGRTDVRPATFLGGFVGSRCEHLLRTDDGFDPLIVATESPTREILTVRTDATDAQTAFFDPDPAITAAEADALLNAVREVIQQGQVEGITLSGSSPSAATHGLFSDLIALAQTRRIPTFLDTYGPALEGIGGFWPDVIQLNMREAGIYLGLAGQRVSESEILYLLDRWNHQGVRVCLVTDGANRFLARVGKTTYRVAPPAIEPVNPIGSGDCMLAGLTDGFLGGRDPESLLKHAVGCAVANATVWDAGGIDREAVERYAAKVEVERLG